MKRRSFSASARVAIFRHHGGICHICHGNIHVGQQWEVEHVIPLAQGGTNEIANTRPAHRDCHAGKTAKDAADTARAKRREARHIGAKPPPKVQIKSAGFAKKPAREPKPTLPPRMIYR